MAATVGLTGSAVIVFLGLFALKSMPGFWVGLTFLATCGLLGMTVLGAASGGQGNACRSAGSRLFGVGYMTLAFGRSRITRRGPAYRPTICCTRSAAGFLPSLAVFRRLPRALRPRTRAFGSRSISLDRWGSRTKHRWRTC